MGRAPRILLIVLLAALAGPRFADAASWSSFIRPMRYTDALASRDTLWFATLEGGLRRYVVAGDRFDAFTRERGALASNALTSLAIDRSGKLWIGTLGDGLSRLHISDGANFRRHRFGLRDRNGHGNSFIGRFLLLVAARENAECGRKKAEENRACRPRSEICFCILHSDFCLH